MTVTVVRIVEAYTKPTRFRKARVNYKNEFSIYILPGADDDFSRSTGEDYEEFVWRRGILIAERLDAEQAKQKVDEIRSKFGRSGFNVNEAEFVND